MNKTEEGAVNTSLFVAFSLLGLLAAALWIVVGEHWEVLADGKHYMAMLLGQAEEPPFAYRVLTPWLAHLLPWAAELNFGVVTVASLSMATGFVALYARQSGMQARGVAVMCLLWATSFAFVYYNTTRVRADAPMFMMLAVLFWLAKCRVSAMWLGLTLCIGGLSHETMLIGLVALGIDKLLSTDLLGGAHVKYVSLVCMGGAALAVLMLARLLTPTIPAVDPSYIDGPYAMFLFTLHYSGGPVKHAMRIYAAFGPALLYAAMYLATGCRARERSGFAGLLAVAILATFLATDTLRVMALVILPVLFYAARFIEDVWARRGAAWALAFVGCQLAYAWLVYGHLRTFKTSHSLNMQAAALSGVSLVLLLVEAWRSRAARACAQAD